MKSSAFVKLVCVASLTTACIMGLTACSGSSLGTSTTSGPVAATVNGTNIYEGQVTETVETVRTQLGLTDESTWAEWMEQNGYTPEKVREEVLDTFIDQELVRQGAAEKGVTAEEDEVNSYIDSMKSYYDTDEAWQSALESAGMSEDEYRTNIENSLLSQGLYQTFATSDEPSEEELVTKANDLVENYDGAKKSSHILFNTEDEDTAQEVLNQLKSGSISFEDAAKEYSKDSSASNGGNVGWDKLTSFVTEYQSALDELDKGEMSGLVTSSYGIHIIKCTDVFHAPSKVTSMDQLPDEFVDEVKSQVQSEEQQTAYNAWLEEYREQAEIVINEIPDDVSYNVTLSEGEADSGEEGADPEAESADGSSDEAATSEEEKASEK